MCRYWVRVGLVALVALATAEVSARADDLRSAMDRKDHAAVISMATATLGTAPRDLEALLWRACAYLAVGKYDEALADRDALAAADTKGGEHIRYLAVCVGNRAIELHNEALGHHKEKRYDESLALCATALHLDPKLVSAHSLQASSFIGKAEYARAGASLDRALALDPRDAYGLVTRVELLDREGKFDGVAAAIAAAAPTQVPKGINARFLVSCWSRHKDAVDVWIRANRTDVEARVALADLAVTQHEQQLAHRAIDGLDQVAPLDAPVQGAIARVRAGIASTLGGQADPLRAWLEAAVTYQIAQALAPDVPGYGEGCRAALNAAGLTPASSAQVSAGAEDSTPPAPPPGYDALARAYAGALSTVLEPFLSHVTVLAASPTPDAARRVQAQWAAGPPLLLPDHAPVLLAAVARAGTPQMLVAGLTVGNGIGPDSDAARRALHAAVEAGQTENALALMGAGVTSARLAHGLLSGEPADARLVDAVARSADQSIAASILRNDEDAVRAVLKADPPGPEASTLLRRAVIHRRANAVKPLIEAGANVNAFGDYVDGPLHMAVTQGDAATASALIACGADANRPTLVAETRRRRGGLTLKDLFTAIGDGVVMGAANVLSGGLIGSPSFPFPSRERGKRGTDTYTVYVKDASPLHIAARQGNAAVVGILVRAGARLDARDAHGMEPLHAAAQAGSLPAVTALVEAGASPVRPTADGMPPISYACAAPNGTAAAVIDYLIAKGAAPDGTGKADSALPLAQLMLRAYAECPGAKVVDAEAAALVLARSMIRRGAKVDLLRRYVGERLKEGTPEYRTFAAAFVAALDTR